MNILALDLGTRMGWAAHANGVVLSGRVVFDNGRYEGGGARFLKFQNWLNEIRANMGEVNAVAFEEVRNHLGVDAAHIYGGFLAVLSAWCERNNVPYFGFPVGTVKKHATGKGNASKPEMVVAMQLRFGGTIESDDEADALAVLSLAAKENGITLPRRGGVREAA